MDMAKIEKKQDATKERHAMRLQINPVLQTYAYQNAATRHKT
jgi:hypothetical protein